MAVQTYEKGGEATTEIMWSGIGAESTKMRERDGRSKEEKEGNLS